jgi:hypothetical protein
LGDDLATLINNLHNAPNCSRLGACTKMKKTWCADFFDDTDDILLSRSVIISADSEDEAVDLAIAQMGNAVHIQFTRTISMGN